MGWNYVRLQTVKHLLQIHFREGFSVQCYSDISNLSFGKSCYNKKGIASSMFNVISLKMLIRFNKISIQRIP